MKNVLPIALALASCRPNATIDAVTSAPLEAGVSKAMRTTYAFVCSALVACGAAPAQQHDAPQPIPASPRDATDAGVHDVLNLGTPADAVVDAMQLALDELVAPLKPSDCVREARSRLEAALRSAKERRDELRAALGRRDQDVASHAYAAILILSTRAAVAADEAQRCP